MQPLPMSDTPCTSSNARQPDYMPHALRHQYQCIPSRLYMTALRLQGGMQAGPQVHHQLWRGGGARAACFCAEPAAAAAGAHAARSSRRRSLAGKISKSPHFLPRHALASSLACCGFDQLSMLAVVWCISTITAVLCVLLRHTLLSFPDCMVAEALHASAMTTFHA